MGLLRKIPGRIGMTIRRLCAVPLPIITAFIFLAVAFDVSADERLAVLKVDIDTYTNVTVTSVTATDIYFTCDKGMLNAKLKNLEPAVQKHFGFDPEKARHAEINQAQADAEFPRQIPQSDKLKEANANLSARFNIHYYPTFILLNANGENLGGVLGYTRGGPSAF